MRVAIATTSFDKIRGIEEAFSRFFELEEDEIKIYSKSIESGVSKQPFNSEIYVGALNRVNNIIEQLDEVVDFCVSCEAGIECFNGIYFNVQVVCVYDMKDMSYFWGKSSGWVVPARDIEFIKATNLDVYLRNRGIQSISDIFGPSYSRSKVVAQAVELALASSEL